MKRKVDSIRVLMSILKFQISAQKASATPPLGPVLGQHKINISDFCIQFNQRTSIYSLDTILKVIVYVYSDRTYELFILLPKSSFLLKRMAQVAQGDSANIVGYITLPMLYEIQKLYDSDLDRTNCPSSLYSLIGSCKSMGLEVLYI